MHSSFNTSYVSVQDEGMQGFSDISASFNTSYVSVQAKFGKWIAKKMNSFNTSYVSVQDTNTSYTLIIRVVSIHPMCRFKMSNKPQAKAFKKVSIHPMCRFKLTPHKIRRM